MTKSRGTGNKKQQHGRDDEEELYEDSPNEQVEDIVEGEGVVTQENTDNKVPVLNSDSDRESIEENQIKLVNY